DLEEVAAHTESCEACRRIDEYVDEHVRPMPVVGPTLPRPQLVLFLGWLLVFAGSMAQIFTSRDDPGTAGEPRESLPALRAAAEGRLLVARVARIAVASPPTAPVRVFGPGRPVPLPRAGRAGAGMGETNQGAAAAPAGGCLGCRESQFLPRSRPRDAAGEPVS